MTGRLGHLQPPVYALLENRESRREFLRLSSAKGNDLYVAFAEPHFCHSYIIDSLGAKGGT